MILPHGFWDELAKDIAKMASVQDEMLRRLKAGEFDEKEHAFLIPSSIYDKDSDRIISQPIDALSKRIFVLRSEIPKHVWKWLCAQVGVQEDYPWSIQIPEFSPLHEAYLLKLMEN